VRPNSLEQSNVNPVLSLVQLMTVSRRIEMAQRAIITQERNVKTPTNELGKVG